jgi:ankyrin repeat protein
MANDIGVVFMVDHTIRTSAWAHNCGMHVIADYLVEKINNRNFQAVFTGAPYDALLTQFRTIYQQDNLSWHTLQRLTTKVTKIDSQIIWGYALRAMMTSVFQKNSEYKQALSEQFLEALNAFNNGQLDILSSTYANIFEANSDYFQSLAFLNNHQQANLDYWNRTGFNNYCATLSAFNESSQTFAWLSFDELTLFCRYLKIGSVFDEHKTKASAKNTIIFSNPTKIHWERKVKATQKNKAPEATEKSFFENLDTKRFTVGTKEIGELLFSDLKIEKTLWLDYLNLHTNDILKKCILNKNKKGFIDFIKNNPVINNEYDDLMAFIGAYFSSNELSDWLKTPGMDAKFSIPYNRILLSTVTHQKPFEFNYILSGLFDKLKPNDYMPALLFAIKYNYSDMAVKILDLPYFNQDSDTHKNLAKILNQLDKNKIPALYYGIKNKNLELVKKLLQKGASETTLKKFGKNILHLFSEAGSIEGVEFCLENKVSLFSKDNDGNTALHLAVENNHLAVVRRLVMNIIKYNESVYFPYAKYEWAQKNKQNQSALDIAYDNNFFPIIKHFRKIGYEDLIRKLYTELNNAIQESSNNFDEIISRNNKAIGLTDSNGNTILHYACCLMNNQHTATIISLLIKHGQNVNALNNAGQSSLHLAANKNNTFAIRILLDKKAFIDVIDHHGLTPVHLAVISNSTEALEILKSASASLDIKAFPSAILRLPFSWDSNNPLTARNIIEVISNQSIKYDLRLMSDLPNNDPNNAAHNIIYLSQEGKYVTRDPQGMVHQDALPMDSGLLINQLEQALNNPVFKNTVLSITNKRSHTTALSKKTFNSRKLQAIHYIEDKLNFNNRYHLRLMSDFPNNEPEKAAPNTLYLSVEGKYAIRNTEGLLIQDSLPSGSGIDTNNLKDKLNDSAFKKSVLSITSKRGHTNLTNHYASNLYTELNNLEQTRTYQGLGMLKIGISVAGAAFLGPYFIPIELAKQGCLYAVPTIKKQAGQLYYTIKPGIHNYTWPCISNGFDYGATGISYASDGVFGLMSLNDWYNNFAPRAIGVGCGIGLLKLAQKLGVKNKECQAAVLFLAKEASYALVDAYNKTSPENKAHNAQAYLNIDKNLDHAYEVWTSILGKENGEKFVNAFHFIHQYQEKTYSYLGEMERAFLDPLAKNGKDLLEPFATGGRDALKPYARMGTDFFEQLGTMGKEYSKDFVDLLYLRGKDSLEPLYVRGKDSLESLGKIGADFFEPLYARGKDSLKPLGKVGADFLEQLSTMEENYLKQIKGYTEFQKIAGDVTKVITGVINFTFTPLAMTRLELNNLAETVAECRDRFLIGLNEAIHQNLIPESDYKRVVLNYITDQKIMLYAYKKQDLETQLKQAIIDENEIKIKSVKSIINSLETEITASEKFIKENSEYLSNSKVTNQYHTAQQNKIKAWNNLEDLNTLKTLNPESFIDMAYKDLGTDFSSLELTEYIRTMIHSQGIIINHDSYEAFQSKFDSAQLHNPEFIQNIKSELTTLWKTQVEGHIASSNDNFSAVYEKSQIEFDESLKSFVGSANPEELRVCDLNQNLEILKKKYDINLKYKNDYNQKNAFVQARFSPFIRDSLAYDEARDNLLIEEFLFEQTEHESNKIINESKAIYEQIEKELNLNFINLDKTQLMKEIANHVVSGKEGKEDRDKATKLMLDWAVCTGLLRSDEALTHKGDFYDALKKTEGKSVENEIKEALNKALFKAASVLLTNANAKIAAQNQLIESARQKLHAQKETFNKHQAILDNTKEITLKKLTSEDQHNFESFSKNLLKDISSSSEYYRELSEQNYLKKNYQELQALQTWASKLLEVQSRRLESLMKDLSEREPGYSNSTCTIIEKISTLIDSELSPIGSAKTNQLGDDAFFKKHFDNLLPDVAHEPRVVINVSDIKIKSESRK